jgi:hypothetical protein
MIAREPHDHCLPFTGIRIPENCRDDTKSCEPLMNTDHAWILIRTSGHTIDVSAKDTYQKNGTDSRTAVVCSSFDTLWRSQRSSPMTAHLAMNRMWFLCLPAHQNGVNNLPQGTDEHEDVPSAFSTALTRSKIS